MKIYKFTANPDNYYRRYDYVIYGTDELLNRAGEESGSHYTIIKKLTQDSQDDDCEWLDENDNYITNDAAEAAAILKILNAGKTAAVKEVHEWGEEFIEHSAEAEIEWAIDVLCGGRMRDYYSCEMVEEEEEEEEEGKI